jgi:ubiquitin carboxyl-terminal hydrolase 7
MSAKAGEYLRHDPIKLRFTTTHATNGTAKAVLKRSLNQSVSEIMAPYYSTSTIILYEKLDVSIVELETKRSLRVTWTGIHNKEEASYPFLLPKTSSVHDLAEHLSKLVTLTPGGTGKIRVFEISKDGKMQKEFTGSEMIGNIPDPVDLYAEVSHVRNQPFFVSIHACHVFRKFLARRLKPTTVIKSSGFSTSPKSFQGRTVFLSNSS